MWQLLIKAHQRTKERAGTCGRLLKFQGFTIIKHALLWYVVDMEKEIPLKQV